MEQLRALLKGNEEQHILELVKASADITTKDEGGLFSTVNRMNVESKKIPYLKS